MSPTESQIDRMRALVEADGLDQLAQYRMGCAYLEAGEPMRAIPVFRRCVEINPEYAAAWLALGRCYIPVGVAKEARAALLTGQRVARETNEPAVAAEIAKLLAGLPQD